MFTLDKTARKRIATGVAAVLGTALMAFEAMPAQAAPPKHAPAWGYRRKQQQNTNHRRITRADIDGDGIPNGRDRDMDGDGIPNTRDRDRDGDGIPNTRDRDDSGRWARDSRGNWFLRNVGKTRVGYGSVPTGYYRDRNGKLVKRAGTHRVGDKDGDGVRNSRDRDVDGDGVRNWRDRDKDGDKVRNKNDRYDKNPRRR